MRLGSLSTSYRRRWLDKDLERAAASLAGVVIDLGGENKRRRGKFSPPRRPSLSWICINVDASVLPEVIADAGAVPLASTCADAVFCTEVLEHVYDPDKVVAESYRLLRSGGCFIITMPFLHRIHADPEDQQRFTPSKLGRLLAEAGYFQVDVRAQGYYFTVLADMFRGGLTRVGKRPLRWLMAAMMLPLLKLLVHLDATHWVRSSSYFSSYSTGYFVTATKP